MHFFFHVLPVKSFCVLWQVISTPLWISPVCSDKNILVGWLGGWKPCSPSFIPHTHQCRWVTCQLSYQFCCFSASCCGTCKFQMPRLSSLVQELKQALVPAISSAPSAGLEGENRAEVNFQQVCGTNIMWEWGAAAAWELWKGTGGEREGNGKGVQHLAVLLLASVCGSMENRELLQCWKLCPPNCRGNKWAPLTLCWTSPTPLVSSFPTSWLLKERFPRGVCSQGMATAWPPSALSCLLLSPSY